MENRNDERISAIIAMHRYNFGLTPLHGNETHHHHTISAHEIKRRGVPVRSTGCVYESEEAAARKVRTIWRQRLICHRMVTQFPSDLERPHPTSVYKFDVEFHHDFDGILCFRVWCCKSHSVCTLESTFAAILSMRCLLFETSELERRF